MNDDQKERIKNFCISGLLNDGGHHKQYFLERILAEIADPKRVAAELLAEEEPYEWEPGIPP